MKMRDTKVGVWSYSLQRFIPFIPCPGEKRVRVDFFGDLDDLVVWPVEYRGNLVFSQGDSPLPDWTVSLS